MHTLKYLVHVIITPELAFIPTFQFFNKEKQYYAMCILGFVLFFSMYLALVQIMVPVRILT